MPDPHAPGERTPEQRSADHASLARLSETLVPALVAKLNASGLGELEVREGDWRIRLRRTAGPGLPAARRADRPRLAQHGSDREARPARDAAGGVAAAPGATTAGASPGPPGGGRTFAMSPAVGVFRPSAEIGARLRAGDRIGIVDLLGMPEDVIAPVDGTLAELLVPPGEAVEYGEPIAAVEDASSGDDREDEAHEPVPGEG